MQNRTDKNLYERIENEIGKRSILKIEIPPYISKNLKHDFFDWQKKAIQYFLSYKDTKNGFLKEPTHLMFNMATGTGKTLLMAATMLYYYKQGYRHFIFFVNQNNIVDKTENNFIDSTHAKYLFKDRIVIDDKTVEVKKVESFSDDPQGIEIKFTTIQKLYNDIHIEKENQVTLEDLHQKDIVMLADEAHHLNAETKKNGELRFFETALTNKTNRTEVERKGWEHTVINSILNKNRRKEENKNVLLEFTATIPTNAQVAEKYSDKIIYRFELKKFLTAGYTKEINLIASTLDKKERVLQALLFHWYRHKIALENGIANFKPVILFRSKTIEESHWDYEKFLNWINDLTSDDFAFLKNVASRIQETKQPTLFEMGKSRTEQVLDYIKKENVSYSEIANFIKDNFKENINVIITNSKTNKTKAEKTSEEQEKLLNSLEDKNNHIRAIFTVNRLTEGWDVLNLFDIVRLYQGQNAGGTDKKTPEATIKEKQLIGRGVRYFPFAFKGKQRNERKFDNNLGNELRILEELHYYTYDEESRYISHLKNELRKDGYVTDDKTVKTFRLKEEFQETAFYKKGEIWYNKPEENPEKEKKNLADIKEDFPILTYEIRNLAMSEEKVNLENETREEIINVPPKERHTIFKKFRDIEKHIIRKAVNIKAKAENSFYQFERLKNELKIKSIDDLLKDDFLGELEMKFIVERGQEYDDILADDKLKATLEFLDAVFSKFKGTNAKQGSDFMRGKLSQFFGGEKTKIIDTKKEKESEGIAKELKEKNWYVLDSFHGTSEEKGFIQFMEAIIGNLEKKYQEIYLIKNEEVYKIYDFEQGRGFQPDFLLFLKDGEKKSLFYQVFIEPKGEIFLGIDGTFKTGKEGWKEKFLDEITTRYSTPKTGEGDPKVDSREGMETSYDRVAVLKVENKHYKLIGLPFFNKESDKQFQDKFNELILGSSI